MTVFQYHPEIVERFPTVVGGIIVGSGLKNAPTPALLLEQYLAEQKAIVARGDGSLSEIPSLAAWRSAFRKFGVEPTKYRSAGEALLRRLTKKGDIPSINTLVDIGNLVSIRYALPVAVVDRRAPQGAITVHFADGAENYVELDREEADPPKPGEVVFTDETKRVIARRWCWRQSMESAARDDTTDVIITVEAHHENGHADIEKAVADLTSLMQEFAGGSYRSGILDSHNLAME
jgi:DNA/RNA-binding domain of Phe-tRNA-synthetase-like protein